MAGLCPSSESVFVLCDIGRQGFPIQYVSEGFASLYGYGQAECVGKSCGDLMGARSIKQNVEALARLADVSGLAQDRVSDALDVLRAHAGQQCCAMCSEEHFGFSLQLNRKKDGEVFVCELLMVVLKRPELGWSFALGFQRDVTRFVSVESLLSAAAHGKLQCLVDESKSGIQNRLAQLGIGGGDVAKHVHDNAVQRSKALKPSSSAKRPTDRHKRRAADGNVGGSEHQDVQSASLSTTASGCLSSKARHALRDTSARVGNKGQTQHGSGSSRFGFSLGSIPEGDVTDSDDSSPANDATSDSSSTSASNSTSSSLKATATSRSGATKSVRRQLIWSDGFDRKSEV